MDKRPIGVMDSGVGGMSTVRSLRMSMPGEDIIYFGDTARVPYGTRSPEEITRLSMEDAEFLLSHDVKCILVSCGTISSNSLDEMRRRLPVPLLGVIEPAAAMAAAATKNGRIGIIATQATVNTGAYEKNILLSRPSAVTRAVACPDLVTLVEAGLTGLEDAQTREAAAHYLSSIMDAGCDTLIMGCTHFTLLEQHFRLLMGDDAALISAGHALAEAARKELLRLGLASDAPVGSLRVFISGRETARFAETAGSFFGAQLPCPVAQVDISAR